MAATLAELTALQSATLAAITALTTGGVKSYSVNGRSLTRNDLSELRTSYEWVTSKIAELSAPRRVSASVVRFNRPK